ncbi:MAG TPA: tyrosine-protein phosphatase, partial [Patescibacteria group bacterium]|nr:tyrosine-protein phosphatase [Patescibacteria group bacterium]
MGNPPVGSGPRQSRRLDWPDCRNARDLGGLPLRGGHTRWGVLVRCDSTANLTPAGGAAMRAHGIATIVDLRRASEVARSPYRGDREGPVYRHLPIVEDEMTTRLDEARDMLERYLMILDFGRARMRPIFE